MMWSCLYSICFHHALWQSCCRIGSVKSRGNTSLTQEHSSARGCLNYSFLPANIRDGYRFVQPTKFIQPVQIPYNQNMIQAFSCLFIINRSIEANCVAHTIASYDVSAGFTLCVIHLVPWLKESHTAALLSVLQSSAAARIDFITNTTLGGTETLICNAPSMVHRALHLRNLHFKWRER